MAREFRIKGFGRVWLDANRLADLEGQIAAISKAQAVIEFELNGRIIHANDSFLTTMGYRLEEVRGQHHSMFVDAVTRDSAQYRQFWAKLGRGEYDANQYKRIGKGGREIWIQATYNPILDSEGRPFKVVKYATDVTRQVAAAAEGKGQLAAVNRAQAVIEFELDGRIITANENFLKTVGYRLDEVQGRHHRMFVAPQYAASEEYLRFWQKLARGEYESGQYKRIGNGGRDVWIQGSYNPIFDADGKPYKVVKFATDITEQIGLKKKMEESAQRTLEIIAGATEVATEVFRRSEEISQGNMDLSQRTEEQSASLEETASAMEEMTSTVKQNADNAGEANQLATAARNQAENGESVVGNAVGSMVSINAAANKIADIIGVIDEIAFQTNLLALNAAVEAARAGEQGRGFAVVATEVRGLAGRSATAAKEIKILIQDSVKKIAAGSELVTESGHTLKQIVLAVKKVSDIVAEIAAASREQFAGIEQVSKAVMQMDEVTQQNAALVEQASASSHELAGQARHLNEIMNRYRAAAGGGEQAPVAAPLSFAEPADEVQ